MPEPETPSSPIDDHSFATLYHVVQAQAAAAPHDEWIVFEGHPMTYASAVKLADDDARRLASLGVGVGDRVVLWLGNEVRWVSLFLACARLGAVAVLANRRLRALDLTHILRSSKARVLVCSPDTIGGGLPPVIRSLSTDQRSGALPHLESIVATGYTEVSGVVSLDALQAIEVGAPSSDPSGVAVICFTSGTTGLPKGCMHDHRTLLHNAEVGKRLTGLTRRDRILCPVPFSHVFGFLMGVIESALAGATLINAEPYEAEALLDSAQGQRATVLYAVPTIAREFSTLQRQVPRDLSSLRLALVAGAPVTESLRRAVTDHSAGLGLDLSVVYGCTEAPTLTQLLPWDNPPDPETAVGRPTPGVCVRVTAPGETAPLQPGEIGEVLARGYNEMLGYLDDRAATAAKYRSGWMVTGDLGWVDDREYLHIAGRTSEMFIVGGFNAYPQEIEGQLEQMEGIAEVAVVGVPDERLGSVPMAWIVPKTSELHENAVLQWGRECLAGYKRPRHVRITTALPRTSSGKISRAELEILTRQALPDLPWESE